MAHDVFISYSTRNATVADTVCAGLERRGLRCWIAPRDITAGQTWAGAIIEAIDTCKVFVLIVSSASNCSDDVLQEVQNAASAGVPIIPFRIEDIALSDDMRFYLGTRQWLDALTKPLEQHIVRLAETVELLLKRETKAVGQAEGDGTGSAAESTQSQSSVTADEPSGAEVRAGARAAAGGSVPAVEPLRSRGLMRLVIPAVALAALIALVLFAHSAVRNSRQDAAQGDAQTAGKAEKPWKPPRAGRRAGEEVTGPDGGTLVYVLAGSFMMGSDDGEYDEKPAHRVELDGFWLGKYEVTNAQYREFCKATGWEFPLDSSEGDDHPVMYVSWDDAKAYCEHYGLSLPTEAQWEYAAAGPDSRVYPWGSDWDPQRLCWSGSTGPSVRTSPVGSFPAGASWCGAHDMEGNVQEWCADWYDRDYYAKARGRNPSGPGTASAGALRVGDVLHPLRRVLRGGEWYTDGENRFRCANRNCGSSSARDSFVGFRCAGMP